MSDKIVQVLTGRIFKEPVTTEKAIKVEVVSNLYQKSDDPKANTHPLYTSVVLTGNLMKLWSTRMNELVKGAKVNATGDWNFSLFVKKDGTAGFSGSLFPVIFEVSAPRTSNATSTESFDGGAQAEVARKEDELPF